METDLPIKEPTISYGYGDLSKEEKKIKNIHPLCSYCSHIHNECTILETQTACRFYSRYNNGDTYHPKSLTHKLGIYFISPSFGIICLLLILSTFIEEELLTKAFPYLALGGLSCFGLIFLLTKTLGRRKSS